MIEQLTIEEKRELIELRRSESYKLFKQKIVQPLDEQLSRQLIELDVQDEKRGPIWAAQLRILRKVFNDLNDAIMEA